jgi:hypothetical protein
VGTDLEHLTDRVVVEPSLSQIHAGRIDGANAADATV